MVNFKERTAPTTSVKYSKNIIPKVIISDIALQKMFVYTSEVADEVGWLGTVEQLPDNTYMISDTYLFEQQVHGATTEISPEGLMEFGMKLLEQPDGADIWNKMQMWGHSHVNMPISPSGQDDKQMQEFSGNGYPFFIRLICNKKGDMKLDFYDYENGFEFHDIPWVREVKENPIQKRIDELLAEIDALEASQEQEEKATVDAISEPIKAEIKEKVKKFVYNYGRTAVGGVTYGYGGKQTQTSHQQTWNTWNKGKVYDSDFAREDAIDGVNQTVYSFYSQKELMLMAQTMSTIDDLKEEMVELGMNTELSINDVNKVWNVVLYYYDQVFGGRY